MSFPAHPFARLALGIAASAALGAHAATVTVACGPTSGARYEFCKKHTDAWAKKTGHNVQFFSTPASTTDTLAIYRQMFASKSADMDVVMIDVVWPGVLKDHLIDLKPYSKGAEAEHFPSIVANNTVDGKLLGMPWYADAGLLYFRKDLLAKHGLAVPQTWEEMAAAGKKVQDAERAAGKADFSGFVFQGKAYEGLTCNALEWVASHGGGTIVDGQGNITINNPKAAKALETVATWVGTITPTGVMNYAEEDARGVFQNGNALFMRNWGYAWKLTQAADSPVQGKVGVAALPKGGTDGKSASTLGGRQLAVSKYSRQPELAADLVMFMTNAEMQKDQSVAGSFLPTRPGLYKDKDVQQANPHMAEIYELFVNAVARPSAVVGMKYPEVTNAFWDAAHETLSKKSSAQDSLKKLEGKLAQIKRNKW